MNNTCILCPQFFDWYSIYDTEYTYYILYQSKNCGHRIHVLYTVSVEKLWTQNTRIIYCISRRLLILSNEEKRMIMKILKKEWFIWKFWKRGVVEKRREEETKSMPHAPVDTMVSVSHLPVQKTKNKSITDPRFLHDSSISFILYNGCIVDILMWIKKKVWYKIYFMWKCKIILIVNVIIFLCYFIIVI